MEQNSRGKALESVQSYQGIDVQRMSEAEARNVETYGMTIAGVSFHSSDPSFPHISCF